MLTAVLVLMSLVLVYAAGEAVRNQCRRMLVRPLATQLGASEGAGKVRA